MIPIHAGAEIPPGGATPDGMPGGAPLDGVPGGAADAWGGGAAGSGSVMTNQRYYAAPDAQGAPARLAARYPVLSAWRDVLVRAAKGDPESAAVANKPAETRLFAGWHGLC